MVGEESTATYALGLEGVADRGFLGRLRPERVAEVVEFGRQAHYPAGTVLVGAQDGRGPAILVAGALRYFLTAPNGRQVTVRYIGPGGLVGTVVREPSGNASSVEVLIPSVVLHLDGERLRQLAKLRPDLAEALLDDAVDRMRAAYRALASRAFTTVQARVAHDILDRAEIAGPVYFGAQLAVTQQSLADGIGSVREVVARALGELRRAGAIARRRDGITILDVAALRKAAGDVT